MADKEEELYVVNVCLMDEGDYLWRKYDNVKRHAIDNRGNEDYLVINTMSGKYERVTTIPIRRIQEFNRHDKLRMSP